MSASAEARRGRAERVRAAVALDAKGTDKKEIARLVGVSAYTVGRYLHGAEGSRSVELWTRESVIEAIKSWFLTYGETPALRDWTPRLAEPERRARYRRLRAGRPKDSRRSLIPSGATVVAMFGTWNAAIEAAGFEPRAPGGIRRTGPDTRTRCRYGHRLEGDNVYLDWRGHRRCRTCQRKHQRESARRTRKEAREKARKKAAPTQAGPPPGLLLGTVSLRERRVAEIFRLRAEGLLDQEIAERLGLSRVTVSNYAADPDRKKELARRKRYSRPCPQCGAPMDGSSGRSSRAPKLCNECSHAAQIASKFWTRERVIDAIQRYAAEHGEPPTAADWRKADPERGYPSTSVLYRHGSHKGAVFASFAEAIEAAGFERPPRGVRRDRRRPLDADSGAV